MEKNLLEQPHDNEFEERLEALLTELKLSFERLSEENESMLHVTEERMGNLEESVQKIKAAMQRHWREVIIQDDLGIIHRAPRTGFCHLSLILDEPDLNRQSTSFPLPSIGFPCLRVFSASFPGVCIDFRAEGTLPAKLLKSYKTMEANSLSASDFLKELSTILAAGKALVLKPGDYGEGNRLSIKVTTYQYQH